MGTASLSASSPAAAPARVAPPRPPAEAHAGRIGPNAILQTVAVLRVAHGDACVRTVLAMAGLAHYADHPPEAMVPEADVHALAAAVAAACGTDEAEHLLRAAGERTAAYLLAHRIPAPAQWVLRRLPAAWAAPLLARAMAAHAWTFAGTGRFTAARRPQGMAFAVAGCPLCRGDVHTATACAFYRGTFEALFRALVHPRTTVRETACEARGADACRFEVRWP